MYILQIIACIVYSIIIICAIKDFKRTIIVWVPLSLLFNPQICVIYAPATALTVALNISLIGLYIIHSKGNKRFNNERFLLKYFMAFTLFSILISSLFSVIPFVASIKSVVKSIIMEFGMIYIFFRCISTSDDIRLYLKTCIIVILVILINGLIENFTPINPIGDFIFYSSPHTEDLLGRSYYIPGSEVLRFGLKRCYSVFSLHHHFGKVCAILFFILFVCYHIKFPIFNHKAKVKRYLITICLCLLPVGVILSNSKTPMLGFIVLLLAFYRLNQLLNIKLVLPLVVGCILIAVYVPDYINNLVSLFDDDIAEEGRGSTFAMRENQLTYILKLFEQSPIWGNGMNAALYYSKNVYGYEDILGAESVWFQLLADQGFLGVLAYIYMFIICFRFMGATVPKRITFFFLAALFLMETTGGAVNRLAWFPIIIILRKLYQLEQKIEFNISPR